MVTNLMLDAEPDYEPLSNARVEEIEAMIGREFDELMDTLELQDRRAVLVTNEVGCSLVSPYRMGRVVRRHPRAAESAARRPLRRSMPDGLRPSSDSETAPESRLIFYYSIPDTMGGTFYPWTRVKPFPSSARSAKTSAG